MKKNYYEVHVGFFLLMLFIILLFTPIKSAYALDNLDMTTHHNDNEKTGANLRETILNTSNVNKDTFGKLFSLAVDGQVYTQPLYLSNFDVHGKKRNVVFIGTMHNTVYCFDADDGSVMWTNNLDPSVPLPNKDVGPPYYFDIKNEVGILSTPVIARDTNTMYLVDMTYSKDPTTYSHKLYALDLTTGAVKGNAKKIEATVPGTAEEGDGSTVSWNSQFQSQRVSLTLANGRIYFGSASFADRDPYHGWILGYNATTLEQEVAFNTTPNGYEGGVWQSGQGVTVDSEGNVYFVSGNGSNDANNIGGDTVFKLSNGIGSPTTLLDWFTPWNYPLLNSQDVDLGSTGILLIPGTDRLLLGSKEGKLYLLDRQSLGHSHDAFLDGTDAQIVQSLKVSNENVHGTPVYWEGPNGKLIYVWAEADTFKAFKFDGANYKNMIDPTPFSEGKIKIESMVMPGGILSLSANGSQKDSGIVWVNMPLSKDSNRNTVEGILRAYDATDLTKELWNSTENDARDHLGNFGKFVPPTVMNGKVYMSTFGDNVEKGTLNVYGIIKDATLTDLHFSQGHLSPVFSKDTEHYDLSVTNDVYSIIATPSATDSQSSIKINGTVVQSGQSSSAIDLSSGSTITINVYGADGLTTNNYTVHVVRSNSNALLSDLSLSGISLDNTVTSGVYDYSASISRSINSVTVTATPQNSQATIVLKVDGKELNSNVAPLGMSNSVISIEVISVDGQARNMYKVNINRTSNNASLSDINLSSSDITLDRSFSETEYTYSASVPYGTSATLVTAPTSESKASMALKKNGQLTGRRIGLNMGLNEISFEVTAEDGISTKLYKVNLYRSPILFIADIKEPTNQNVAVNIYYPEEANVKQVSTDSSIWTDYTAPIIAEDNESIFARYKDHAGHWSEVSSFQITNIDKRAPAIATFIANTTSPTNQDVTVTVNFPDDANVKQVRTDQMTWIPYIGPITVAENKTIYAKSQDSVGNWSEIASYAVTNIDKTAPTKAILTADITIQTTQSVTITVTFPVDANVKQVCIDQQDSWIPYTGPITVSVNKTIQAKSQDSAGNWSEVSSIEVKNIDKTLPSSPPPGSPPPGSPPSGSPPPGSPPSGSPPSVPPASTIDKPAPPQVIEAITTSDDGQTISKGTAADGQAQTIVAIDGDKLLKNFKSDGQTSIVSIAIKGNDPIVIINLPSNALIDALNGHPDGIVELKYDGTIYQLPLAIFIDLPKNTNVSVTLSKVFGKAAEDIKAAIEKQGAQPLLANPIDFKISVDGQEITDFHGIYVDRIITLDAAVDSSKASAVWIDANNNMHFIPYSILNTDGGSVVAIHSPHNSTYAIIQSDKTFSDIKDHWAIMDIEALVNKLIVKGITNELFAPEKEITRAEFVAILTRALGLVELKSNEAFSDVKSTDWFDSAIGAAVKAKLVSGYEDKTFKPNDIITRQQMVLILARALKIGGKEIAADAKELNKFTDKDSIADWAKDAASQLLSLKIVEGTTSDTFAATEAVTRAQAAAMTKRLLQAVHFI